MYILQQEFINDIEGGLQASSRKLHYQTQQ